ncbi:MAG: hypothetical protein ABEJ83_01015 [Candidatus Nanohaloarchaea archaeon]
MEEVEQELKQIGITGSDLQLLIEKLTELQDEINQQSEKISALEEKIDEVRKDQQSGIDLSGVSKFKVTDGEGEPTPQAQELRKKVIKNGEEGLTTREIEGEIDCSRPTAHDKMEQMASVFDELEVYSPRGKAFTNKNQPDRLRHKDSESTKFSPKKILKEERDNEYLICDNTDSHPDPKPVGNVRKVWREKLDWSCPECGQDPR